MVEIYKPLPAIVLIYPQFSLFLDTGVRFAFRKRGMGRIWKRGYNEKGKNLRHLSNLGFTFLFFFYINSKLFKSIEILYFIQNSLFILL